MFQGHIYSLIGASGDDRFALMHLGYKHSHGADGFPKDWDMAYSYYSNVGAQSSADCYRAHEYKVAITANLFIKYYHTSTALLELNVVTISLVKFL